MRNYRDRSGARRRTAWTTRLSRTVIIATGLLALSLAGLAPAQAIRPAPQEVDLPALLDKLTAYARRLENVVLDFVCREEIGEKIDYTLDAWASSPLMDNWSDASGLGINVRVRVPKVTKNSYVYDYQCIRKDRVIKESRTLLQENKTKKNEPNAVFKAAVFVFGNALLGPVSVFAERFRPLYTYKLSERDKIDKKPVVIVEAVPADENAELRTLYGRYPEDRMERAAHRPDRYFPGAHGPLQAQAEDHDPFGAPDRGKRHPVPERFVS
jgi:hypothetical protein